MSDSRDYNVNFFKPLTQHAKANKWLILTLVVIWAVGVFGFQFLLIIFNDPTPEKNYETFQSVWPAVIENPEAGIEQKQDFCRVLLGVLGKNIAVLPQHKAILNESLTWTVTALMSDEEKLIFKEAIKNNSADAVNLAKKAIRLQPEGFDKLMGDLLPSSLVTLESTEFKSANKAAIPEIMDLYLIHNQSGLTDFKFLGFPFHYWYTAQFLLIMFVVLCLVYAVITDKENEKYGFTEE